MSCTLNQYNNKITLVLLSFNSNNLTHMNTLIKDDLDAEKELIALFCNYPDYLNSVQSAISPEIFQFAITKASYLACVELISEKGRITHQDLLFSLKSKNIKEWFVMMDIQTIKNPIDAPELIAYLTEIKKKKDLYELSRSIEKDLINGKNVEEIMESVHNLENNVVSNLESDEIVDMKTALKKSLDDIGDVMTNGKTSGVPTGYSKLDDITGGWLKGNVILFAGRPGQGKTIALIEHAKWASKLGNHVLFLSLEMPVDSLIKRMISGALEDGTPYSKINTGRISETTYEKISRKAVTELSKLPITWYDGANRDINYLTNLIQKIVKEKNIKMVVIDYIQLMGDNKIKSNDEFSVVGSVADKIQLLAKKLNIPFICATQLNRATEARSGNRPRLADLRSSGKLEQMASVVIGLYRDDYYAYEKAKEEGTGVLPEFTNTIEYIFLKNRHGDTRTLELNIDVKTSTISEYNNSF